MDKRIGAGGEREWIRGMGERSGSTELIKVRGVGRHN